MNAYFQSTYQEIEAQRDALIKKIDTISRETYHRSPMPGKWSIAQILTHLLTSEQLSVAYMRKKSLGIDKLSNSGLPERWRLGLLIFSQRFPIKYKAPKVVVEHTPPALEKDALTSEWQHTREGLAGFLQSLPESNKRKKIYKHPIAGRLDARQAMIFFREHIRHHTPQIERILNMPDK